MGVLELAYVEEGDSAVHGSGYTNVVVANKLPASGAQTTNGSCDNVINQQLRPNFAFCISIYDVSNNAPYAAVMNRLAARITTANWFIVSQL